MDLLSSSELNELRTLVKNFKNTIPFIILPYKILKYGFYQPSRLCGVSTQCPIWEEMKLKSFFMPIGEVHSKETCSTAWKLRRGLNVIFSCCIIWKVLKTYNYIWIRTKKLVKLILRILQVDQCDEIQNNPTTQAVVWPSQIRNEWKM